MSIRAGIGGGAPRYSWAAARRPAEASFVYAEFPVRAAAFVVDLLLGAALAAVAASVVATIGFHDAWRTADLDGLLLLQLLLAAVIATLLVPIAAAWFWRRWRATPGQRLFDLQTAHRLTGERLSVSAASARAVLLYAPLTLLVALPQLVSAAFDPGPFYILVELPWLPFATMTLPLVWYLALAYPALADRRRVRGLHDRVSGSVVVRPARADAEARPRRDDVEQPLSELVPFVWFARLGLSPWLWLFALGALVVAVDRAIWLLRSPLDGLELLGSGLHGLSATLTVLLPAALLWRVRDAARRYPLLLLGLGLAASFVIVPTVADWLAPAGSQIYGALPVTWLSAIAPVLIGLGLLTMRERGPTHPRLLLAIAALLAVSSLGPFLVDLSAPAYVFTLAAVATFAAMSGFALWVALSAWLDRDRPRRFWAVLTLGIALNVLSVFAGDAISFAARDHMPDIQPVLSLLSGIALALSGALAFVAYGAFAPRD